MNKHEIKTCPRCNQAFECKSGDIINCQCETIELQQRHRDFISERYQDCLCAGCLSELRSELDINQRDREVKQMLIRK